MKSDFLTVSALTKYIKRKFETDRHLRNVWLKGEISNFKHHSRGHMYLTIKDDNARIQAVMFAGSNRYLKFKPENGMKVLVKGEVSVFEPYGQYQLYIQQMEPDGIGALYLAFEQLKDKLYREGVFEEAHKKPIPQYPVHIGIITSPTGAAVRDIITTLDRRYPIVEKTVIPVLVQGENAASSIRRAIEFANERGNFDVLIVGRGGGSIEELWSFNEESVAKAIFASQIPIISAVGHETDTTISDFVADLRAPTPTGAAELAVPSRQDLLERVDQLRNGLSRELGGLVQEAERYLNRIKQSYAFRYPEMLLKQREQELDKQLEGLSKAVVSTVDRKRLEYMNLNRRLAMQHPKKQLEQAGTRLVFLKEQQSRLMKEKIERKYNQWNQAVEKLTLLNPLETMKRGFALPYNAEGEIIKTRKQVMVKDIIHVTIKDGNLTCEVLDVEEANRE
ncbi:exodeoxyribonuclease VII large subunit [Virgibacillus xinjiangensis]|uniref:Exodeoxyribonuclease 7 large subunit n=1 Tax=Virgibacillus xinjiangensis TaxID=393090 RepID=A0ABV7CRP4_9BACI